MRLNVGSGQRRFGYPWINIDSQFEPGREPDVQCRGEELPYEDQSASLIVLHHVLEHYGCGEGQVLLREMHRVLKPSGSLLVFVPDMHALAQRWLMGKLTTQLYLTNVYGAFMGSEDDRHKWGYTVGPLTEELVKAGFKYAIPFDWREIPGADLARAWWVLAMEAVK